jgi:hypothetical protein
MQRGFPGVIEEAFVLYFVVPDTRCCPEKTSFSREQSPEPHGFTWTLGLKHSLALSEALQESGFTDPVVTQNNRPPRCQALSICEGYSLLGSETADVLHFQT